MKRFHWVTAAVLAVVIAGATFAYQIWRDHNSDVEKSPLLVANCTVQESALIGAHDILYLQNHYIYEKMSESDLTSRYAVEGPDVPIERLTPGATVAACTIKNQQQTGLTNLNVRLFITMNPQQGESAQFFDRSFPITSLDGGATYSFDIVNGVRFGPMRFVLNLPGHPPTAFDPITNTSGEVRLESGPDLDATEQTDLPPIIVRYEKRTLRQLCSGRGAELCKDLHTIPLPR